MKKVAGYVGAFVAGTIVSGTVAFAGSNVVQAVQKSITIAFQGQTVATATGLSYKGQTYVPSSTLSSLLSKMGVSAKWSGNQFNWTVAAKPQPSVVGVSKLPYTYTSPNGLQITINKITADSSGTVINVTIANNGKSDGDASMLSQSSIAAGGVKVNYTDMDQTFYDASDLHPGQSVTADVKYEALPSTATQFTLYYGLWVGINDDEQHITFDLSK